MGYIVKVKTEKIKVVRNLISDYQKLIITNTLVDNIVYRTREEAVNRIRTIVKNKCDKHQYTVLYDTLDRHMLSLEKDNITISRNNWEVVKSYTLKQIKIN